MLVIILNVNNFFEGTAPNGQSVKLLYTIQFENINIISTHITSPSWYEVDVNNSMS